MSFVRAEDVQRAVARTEQKIAVFIRTRANRAGRAQDFSTQELLDDLADSIEARDYAREEVVELRAAKCRTCGAKIVWCSTARGKSMPVDFNPTPAGDLSLNVSVDPPLATKATDRENAGPLRTSHFATCAQADEWRGRT